jgi:hypothetical protein
MELEKLGKVAGIGGIAIGAIVLIFRDIIAREIFTTLPPELTYDLLRLIIILAFVIGLVGVLGWIWQQYIDRTRPIPVGRPPSEVGTTPIDDELRLALRELSRLRADQNMYILPTLEEYANTPTAANWKVAKSDLDRVRGAINRCRDAIVEYAAVTDDEVTFNGVNTILLQREVVLATIYDHLSRLPDVKEIKNINTAYRDLALKLQRALSTVKAGAKKS